MVEIDAEREQQFRAALTQGILDRHHEDVCEILFAPDTSQHYSLVIDIMALVDSASDSQLWSQLALSPHTVLPILDSILQDVQKELIRINEEPPTHSQYHNGDYSRTPMFLKSKCSARIMGLPAAESRRMTIPNSADVGTFLSITATVVRTGAVKMLESAKKCYCATCKQYFDVVPDVEQYNQIEMPTRCGATGNTKPCPGSKFQIVESVPGQMPDGCRDYQEIKIQEQTNKLSMGTIPGSMVVILHDDLVDHAKSGDDVTITGTVIRRWKPTQAGERCDIELALLANHVFIHNEQRVGVGVTEEQRLEFEQFWHYSRIVTRKQFSARNSILSQICPKVYGLYIVKLAVMLVLTGGVQKVDRSGLKVRGEPHLLLVGDPGTGKSQFLKYAAELNPRSVLTTGIGSSSAGLTATAVRDGNEWQLEAGALVLADRGLCCIDEFGGMRANDKTAIHEAMEQQTISIAKAGIVCKLNTRCSVIAATNPKGKYDPEQSVSINIALASPLLSRFDIVLVLMDTGNINWDQKISSFILKNRMYIDGENVPLKTTLSRKDILRRRSRLRRRRKLRELEEQGITDPGEVEAALILDREAEEHERLEEERQLENAEAAQNDEDDESQEGRGNRSGDMAGPNSEVKQEPWPIDKLKAYLIWTKSTFEPRLTPPAEQVLVSYYQLQRRADIRNAARTTIRLLESLIRLSQAHARLMARDQVTVEDAVVIVSLMETTAQGGAALLGAINPLHASFPKNAEDEYRRQEEAMLGRLGLMHLASNATQSDEDENTIGRNEDSRPRAAKRRRPGSNSDGTTSRYFQGGEKNDHGLSNGRTLGANGSASSMVLGDDEEAAMLNKYRALDGVHIKEEEEDNEEPLIDRRTSRRSAAAVPVLPPTQEDEDDDGEDDERMQRNRKKIDKGKGVDRDLHPLLPSVNSGSPMVDDDEEEGPYPYGQGPSDQGSPEI
ncbi:DNA helicase MCM9 [Entomortierella parvispora]|uniref:DNA helicase n=1 Tax=Entomortierella parvispora TaxID=205924 RepID=A0A9P3HC68_9FUNG|nr:DNA helicase MCM9 [Entomortierella parvispora]